MTTIPAAFDIAFPLASLLWAPGAWSGARHLTDGDRARWRQISAEAQRLALLAVHHAALGRAAQVEAICLTLGACGDEGRACSEDLRMEALEIASVARRAVQGGAPLSPSASGQVVLETISTTSPDAHDLREALVSAVRGAS